MNIVIISGGSGNDALIKGFKEFLPTSKINILINAYDDGKSTGVCRKITNTLGVSDIRKNQYRLYKLTSKCVDKNIDDFMNGRYDITSNPRMESLSILDKYKLDEKMSFPIDNYFHIMINKFFDLFESKSFNYDDFNWDNFNISNIIYSMSFLEYGYDNTLSYMAKWLNIDDCVLLNSNTNSHINCITDNGYVIYDEGEVVEWCNENNPIKNIKFDIQGDLNQNALECIKNADLLIISTGTFWSSIAPTILYSNLYEYINHSNAKKYWFINNTQDKDSYGVTSDKYINFLNDIGLDLSKFKIIINKDADKSMQSTLINDNIIKSNYIFDSISNNNGKHDGHLMAKCVLTHFYGLNEKYNLYAFDFDDTLRKRGDSIYNYENLILLNKLKHKSIVISGNSYDSIKSRSIKNFEYDVWADSNSVLYRNDEIINIEYRHSIQKMDSTKIENLLLEMNLNYEINDFYIKIKPLNENERNILNILLNHYFDDNGIKCKAFKTGLSTIDILNSNNKKSNIIEKYKSKGTIYYVGDELDCGNDKSVINETNYNVNVHSVEETNCILKLILSKEGIDEY